MSTCQTLPNLTDLYSYHEGRWTPGQWTLSTEDRLADDGRLRSIIRLTSGTLPT